MLCLVLRHFVSLYLSRMWSKSFAPVCSHIGSLLCRLRDGLSDSNCRLYVVASLIISLISFGNVFRLVFQDWRKILILVSCDVNLYFLVTFFLMISSAMYVQVGLLLSICTYSFSQVSWIAWFLAWRFRSFLPPFSICNCSVARFIGGVVSEFHINFLIVVVSLFSTSEGIPWTFVRY